MANREQKSKREKLKPKADKPKSAPQTASFAQPQSSTGASKKTTGKKGR